MAVMHDDDEIKIRQILNHRCLPANSTGARTPMPVMLPVFLSYLRWAQCSMADAVTIQIQTTVSTEILAIGKYFT